MNYTSKCRVCLVEGAEHSIFESIESKESIQFKLFQCFKEKIEDIEGYPRNICESCNVLLDTLCDFITKYQASCKLLEGTLRDVKKEAYSDNDSDNDFVKQEFELEIFKSEPECESLDEFIWKQPLAQIKKQEISLTEIKEKLKSLKEIKFKKKPVRKSKSVSKTGKVTSSNKKGISKCNKKSLKSRLLKKPSEEKLKEKPKDKQLTMPKPKVSDQPPPKLCDMCGEICKNPNMLFKHKQKMHFNKPKKCPKCPRTLFSEYYLKRHTRRVHDKKTFICDHCGRGFAFKGELATHTKLVHLRINRSKKKHVCDKCNKGFVTAKSLTIHERSAHTGLRPAECTECGASFFHEDYLKEHMRLHTGEAPFKCPICGRGYAQRGNMRSHISHNHRLADLSPETIKNLKPMWFKYLKKP